MADGWWDRCAAADADPTADIANTKKIHAVWHRGKKVAGPVETFTP